jgi:hypothetical protein
VEYVATFSVQRKKFFFGQGVRLSAATKFEFVGDYFDWLAIKMRM